MKRKPPRSTVRWPMRCRAEWSGALDAKLAVLCSPLLVYWPHRVIGEVRHGTRLAASCGGLNDTYPAFQLLWQTNVERSGSRVIRQRWPGLRLPAASENPPRFPSRLREEYFLPRVWPAAAPERCLKFSKPTPEY